MFDDYKWTFPNGSQKIFGINNEIETFKDTPIQSLGREICQNSGDVRKDNNKPVRVEFKIFKIKTSDFPDINNFKYAVGQCYSFWKEQKNQKAESFFSTAKATVNSEEITILRISDHNTSGLDGVDRPDDTTANWTALVMSSGASAKNGTQSGSFGLGKYAAFANSKLRTVFYSTVASDGSKASQGISKLATFVDQQNSKTYGEGFCGDETKAVLHQIELDPSFHRTDGDTGTDVYICGFSDSNGWKSKMIAAILDGFLYAIDQKMLVADVDGIAINSSTLDTIIEKYKGYCQKETYDYYQILRSDEKWIYFDDYAGIKDAFAVKFLVNAGLNRRVGMVKCSGMKIYDQGGFNSNILFAGFMYVCNADANHYLTLLENPTHTGWYPDRDEKNGSDYAKKYLAHIRKQIREALNTIISSKYSGEVIPEMGNLLQSIHAGSGDSQTQETISDEPEKLIPKKRNELPPQELTVDSETGDDKEPSGTDGGKDFGNDGKGNGGGGYGQGKGGSGSKGEGSGHTSGGEADGDRKKYKNKAIPLLTKRTIVKNASLGEYLIKLRSNSSSNNATIEIGIVAEDGIYAPEIINATVLGQPNAILNKNRITNIQIVKESSLTIALTIKAFDYTSFEVKCYETED